MKRILHVLSGSSHFTGVASYLYQQYLHIDQNKVVFDFFICKENPFELVMNDSVFEKSVFYFANARMKKSGATNYHRVASKLKEALKNKGYDAVVVNTSVIPIIYTCLNVTGKFEDVCFIAHAHNSGVNIHRKSFRNKFAKITNVIDKCMLTRIVQKSFALFACSEDAGEKTFGKSAITLDKFKVINDAIDVEKFKYIKDDADEIRRTFCADESTFVIGNIGKLSQRKNQAFLIKVFSYVSEKRPNSQLWLIGDGEDKELLKNFVKDLNLEKKVIFLGEKKDVERYYCAMDVFAFTTLSEGLGIVAIEAQAAGLPTVISDGVPKNVILTPLAEQISLKQSAEYWANRIIELHENFPNHPNYSKEIEKAGYSIIEECKRMVLFYSDL